MALNYDFGRVFVSMLLFLCVTRAMMFPISLKKGVALPKVFDVREYGAKGDGTTDNTKAFMKAWNDACEWRGGRSRVYVAAGTYMLSIVTFLGPCKHSISFFMIGTLMARSNLVKGDPWISFRYVDHLVVTGGGTLDGQGAKAWEHNDCHKNPNCDKIPISISFEFVSNSKVKRIKSINSKSGHFNFYACKNINVSNIIISAPSDSPNTDGIKIGDSARIRISHSTIETGDDCIAILSGNTKIKISEVFCGPGHGISVGSLGKYKDEKNVNGLTVRNCTFIGTSDGVRIKTWSSSVATVVSHLTFADLIMIYVGNPIIIDQQYCPHGHCDQKNASHVQIKGVTYRNIRGTSTSKVAVNLQCSKKFPCTNVIFKNINLVHQGPKGPASSRCDNVQGTSYGRQKPPSCV